MSLPTVFRSHWFFFIAPLVMAADVFVGRSARGQVDWLIEAGLLFDLAVLLPCLYAVCYRAQGRKALLKAVALACLGIWVALRLVPEGERDLLAHVAPLRYLGLGALVLLEAAVVVGIYRAVFRGGSAAEAAAAAPADMPRWVARLMALEAGLWRSAWRVLKRLFTRR